MTETIITTTLIALVAGATLTTVDWDAVLEDAERTTSAYHSSSLLTTLQAAELCGVEGLDYTSPETLVTSAEKAGLWETLDRSKAVALLESRWETVKHLERD